MARTVHDLVLAVVQGRTPTGVSVVIEGAPGIGKTFLVREILDSVAPGDAKVLHVVGEQGRRNDPFTVAGQLLAGLPTGGDPGEAAFDRVDELCADGPVVLCADDAHYLDAASLTLLRRLAWASQSLPLALLISTRPSASREQLTMLIRQAQIRLWLPPMSRMMVERLVFDRTGRWPGPLLRRSLGLAAGNPLFAGELLRAYENAGALAEAGPDTIEAKFELDVRGTGLDEVIQAQLGQLDEPARDVLAALAVWGTDIGVGDLAAMLFSPADVLDELIERAISSGLVRRDPAGTIGFSHDLFREVTYAELAEPERRAAHRRAAEVLAMAGYRPSLVADHLLRAAGADADPALVTALQEAVAATRVYAPEVTADLLDDVAAIGGANVPERLLLDHADALFRRGRGESAETLIRERIMAVTDPAVAAQLQVILIRSLMNRAEGWRPCDDRADRRHRRAARRCRPPAGGDPGLAAGPGRAGAACRRAGRGNGPFRRGRRHRCPGQPPGLRRLHRFFGWPPGGGAGSHAGPGGAPPRHGQFPVPQLLAIAARHVRAGRLRAGGRADGTRPRPAAGRGAGGLMGGSVPRLRGRAIAFAAGDWDDAAAELDSALERAEETGTGWISLPVGIRSYIDAHRGSTGPARARLESFRYRGLPLQFGHDRPGWAELAVLEAEGAIREASTLARTLWSAARDHHGRWAADLAPDVTRVALAGMDRRLAGQIGEDVSALCPPDVSRLVHGVLGADPDAIGAAAAELAAAGRLAAEAFAREELACAAAAAGDRDRAAAALDAALAGYQRMGAVPDRDRALGRTRALGIRRELPGGAS